MKNRLINIILLSAFLLALIPERNVNASPSQEIRVGLTSLFADKSEIKVNNTKLTMGYVNAEREFVPEATLSSETGFVFRPAPGYYISLGESCKNYAETISKRKTYFLSESPIVGAVTGTGEWNVYSGPFETYKEAEDAVSAFRKSGAVHAYVLGGNNYRVSLGFGTSTVILDVDDSLEYPQFEAASQYGDIGFCIDLGSRIYRGRLEVGRYQKSTLTAVNVVPLEEYLYGVVASEMPDTWPKEALKAQAVCSRSYAIVKAGIGGKSDAKNGYKINDTTDSQVYRGAMYEKAKTTEAVNATRGELVAFNNKIVATYYFSSGAGSTESAQNVWGFDLPYLMAKADLQEGKYAVAPWRTAYSISELTNIISGYSQNVGAVKDVVAVKQSESGRVSLIRVLGETGSLAFQSSSIRNVLGLMSTKIKIVKSGDNPDVVYVKNASETVSLDLDGRYARSAFGTERVKGEEGQFIVKSASNISGFPSEAPQDSDEIWIYGLGSGHGVGMSQTGAAGLAEKGADYKEIIEYYFKGCKVL